MVVCYRIKVFDFEIRMKHMSQEMRSAKDKIMFHVHDAELCMKNVDISRQRERTFYLDMSPVEANLVKEIMTVTAYKIHKTGTLIRLGTTRVNITEYVNYAIEKEDVFTTIPGSFYFKNTAGKFVAKLECDIKFMIKTDRLSDCNDPQPQQCDVMPIECDVMAIEKDLEFPNPFLVCDPVSAVPDSAAEKIEKEDKIKKD